MDMQYILLIPHPFRFLAAMIAFIIVIYTLAIPIWPMFWASYYSPTFPPSNPGVINHITHPDQKSIFRVVVIGDSTAIGQGTNSVLESFGYQYLLANSSLKNQNWSFENRAKSGVKINYVIDQQLDFEPVDLVMVSIGANDVTGGTKSAEFRASAEDLAKKLKSLSKQVIWLNIPDFVTSPILLPPLNYILSSRAKTINQILDSVVPQAGHQLIDVYNGAREPFKRDPDRFFGADKYHPSVYGYGVWAKVIEKTLRH